MNRKTSNTFVDVLGRIIALLLATWFLMFLIPQTGLPLHPSFLQVLASIVAARIAIDSVKPVR